MPSVVNGCGTWYHFKRNFQRVQGRCEHCGAVTRLTSYDTWLCIVIVFIPVIPLARKRIICQCSSCSRHRVMPLTDYRRLQERATQAQQKLEATPSDEQLAKEALGACVPVRDMEQFLRIAPIVEQAQSDKPDSMMMLAAAYDIFGRKPDVERVLNLMLDARDDATGREAMATCLMDQNRPDEAEPYVAHIIAEVIPDRVDLLYRLAQQYQLKGNHDKALEYFQHCVDVAPAIAQDKVFARLQAASQQALGTTKSVKPADVVAKVKREKSLRSFSRFAAAAIVLLAIGYVIYCSYLGYDRAVYIVSGVDRPYTATIDNQSHVMMPFSNWRMYLSEGEHTVSTRGLATDLPPTPVRMKTSFLGRPFHNDAIVINPDRCAIVNKHKTYYSENPSPHENEYEYFTGDVLRVVPDVDYPFEPFPSHVTLPSGTRIVSKTRLSVAGDTDDLDRSRLLTMFTKGISAERLSELAVRRVECEGANEMNVTIAAHLLGPGKAVEVAGKHLAARPIEMDWHRTYQTTMEQLGKIDDLQREYEGYLTNEPNNPDMQYLTSRVISDPNRRVELLEKAASSPTPCSYAFTSLAFHYGTSGDFAQALRWLDKAPTKMAQRVHNQKIEYLAAVGRVQDALALLKEDENAGFPMFISTLWHEIPLYGSLKNSMQGEAAISRVLQRLGGNSDQYREAKQFATISLAYCLGDLNRYNALAEKSVEKTILIQSAMVRGDLAKAEAEIAKSSEGDQMDFGVGYLVAKKNGDSARAALYLTTLIESLRKDDFAHRAIADALEHGGNWEQLRLQAIEIPEKRVLMTALGLARPELRSSAFELAQKLNVDRSYPYLLIRDITADSR